MIHLPDANACINYMRKGYQSPVAKRIRAAAAGSVGLCSVVIAELLYGAHRSANRVKTFAEVRVICAAYSWLPFCDNSAEEYGQLRAYLESKGNTIGPNDLMIASIALANNLTLVTHNTSEFSRVPNLKIEDWQVP